ncbi:MAG: tetratricopeptide repeat protein [Bacteroidales bacterium]
MVLIIYFKPAYSQISTQQQDQINQNNKYILNYKSNGQYKDATVYLNRNASIYLKAGEYQKAIDCYVESGQLNEKIGNDADNKKIFNNIAMIYSEMGQLKNSQKYFEKSLMISRRSNNKEEIAVSLMDISSIMIFNKEYNQAIKYLEEALKISNDLDNLNSLITCYNLLAQCNRDMGNKKKADEYYAQYQALDKIRREGKTSVANKSKEFINAGTEDLTKEIKPKTKNEKLDTTNNADKKEILVLNFYNKKSSDSLLHQLKQSRDKAADLEMEKVLKDKELKEVLDNQLKLQQEKQHKINVITYFSIGLTGLLILLLGYTAYLLRKKNAETKALKQKLTELEKLVRP